MRNGIHVDFQQVHLNHLKSEEFPSKHKVFKGSYPNIATGDGSLALFDSKTLKAFDTCIWIELKKAE